MKNRIRRSIPPLIVLMVVVTALSSCAPEPDFVDYRGYVTDIDQSIAAMGAMLSEELPEILASSASTTGTEYVDPQGGYYQNYREWEISATVQGTGITGTVRDTWTSSFNARAATLALQFTAATFAGVEYDGTMEITATFSRLGVAGTLYRSATISALSEFDEPSLVLATAGKSFDAATHGGAIGFYINYQQGSESVDETGYNLVFETPVTISNPTLNQPAIYGLRPNWW